METIKKYGKWFVGGMMFVLALAVAIFARRPKPEIADTYKGDPLEELVQTAPIIEQHTHIAEVLKPETETESKDMQSAINSWKTAGD